LARNSLRLSLTEHPPAPTFFFFSLKSWLSSFCPFDFLVLLFFFMPRGMRFFAGPFWILPSPASHLRDVLLTLGIFTCFLGLGCFWGVFLFFRTSPAVSPHRFPPNGLPFSPSSFPPPQNAAGTILPFLPGGRHPFFFTMHSFPR